MSELAGSSVIITGASRGLGRALAVAFAQAGARVGVCARSAAGLDPLRDELRGMGATFSADAVDVSNNEEVAAWAERATALLGPATVLINNASVLGPRTPLLSIGVDDWKGVVDVNLNGTFIVTRAFAPLMVSERRGSIINISSGASLPPRTNWGAYAVSKSALDAFSYNLAAELDGSGVRVNVVDPGAMRTEMRADAYPAEDPASLKEAASIAPLFFWLAGDEAKAVTGERFQADEWLRGRATARPAERA